MKRYILCAVSLIFLCKLSAQEKFDLKDCIAYGLANHKSTVISKNNIDYAKAVRKEARSAYLPTIAINGAVDDNLKVQQSVIPAGIFGDEPLRVAFTQKFNTNFTAQLDQTIFDQSLIIGLKANKYKKKEAELAALQNDEQIIYNISVAYYQVLVYQQQIDFLKQNKDVYAEQVRISQLQVDKGVLAEVELSKVQVNLNNTNSQLRVAETNLANSQNELKNSMGYPIDEAIDLRTDSMADQPQPLQNLDVPTFQAANRLDYQLSEIDAALLKIEYQRIRATNLPKLSFVATYGGVGFGDELGQAFESISSFSAIGLKLTAPLFSGFSKQAKYQQAKIEYLNAVENLKIDEANYRMEAENAKTKLTQAQESMGQERENIKLAQSVLQATDLQYKKGTVGLSDWLTSNFSLQEAQNNFLNSIVDFYVAQVELEKANGTLKNYFTKLKQQ